MSQNTITENKMGTAKMLPLIITMGLPAVFSMMVQALYNIVDSYFVASYSEDALAAVSLAFPIQNLIIAFSVGTAIGVGSLVSRKLGEKNKVAASSAATQGLILNILTWLIFLVFGLLGCEFYFRMFESNETIVTMGIDYLSIVSSLSLFCFIQICFEKILQSTGNMMLPMIMQLVGAVTNMILDPIMIFGYFGLPAMGVKGAAIATVIGQLCASAIATYAVLFSKKNHEVEIHLKGFKFHVHTIKQIYAVGLPSIIMNAIGTIMLMGLNAILSGFSSAAYTVFGLYFKLQSFVFMPVFGLTSGLMPILGYNFGARNKHRIMNCLRIGGTIALSICLLGTLGFLVIPEMLLGIFSPSDEILKIGVPALRVISLTFPLAAISITGATLFQSVGKGIYSMINSVLRQLVVILPAAYFFSFVSLDLVWWAFPLSELVALVVTAVCFIRLYKNEIKNL